MSQPLIVAIDGPAGVGKSTAARRLAEELDLPYLDTGAMYRALALEVLRQGLDPGDRDAVEALASNIDLEVCPKPEARGGLEVRFAGESVEALIRSPEVSSATSKIAVHPAVRQRMVELQQQAGGRYGGVVEGRDIGTRVFPQAPFKFFFEADPGVRAERRIAELRRAGRSVTLEEIAAQIHERDQRDSSRETSPLECAPDAHRVDTSRRSIDEVVAAMLAVIRAG